MDRAAAAEHAACARPVGRELYDWILRRIWLLPFDADDIRRIGEQEYGRYLSFTSFEAARNRGLPVANARARRLPTMRRRRSQTSSTCARSCRAQECSRFRTYVGPYRRTLMPELHPGVLAVGRSRRLLSAPGNSSVKYAVPEDHPFADTYWEAVMRIDPSTNIFHDGIPGHHFQGVVSARHPVADPRASTSTASRAKAGPRTGRRLRCSSASTTSGRAAASCSTTSCDCARCA